MANKDQLIEKGAIRRFIENEGCVFDESLIIFPDQYDYIDVIYSDAKFQITTVPAGAEEVWGRLKKENSVESRQNKKIKGEKKEIIKGTQTPTMEFEFGFDEIWSEYINKPITLKKRKYRVLPQSEELILLIYCHSTSDPPLDWLKKQIEIAKKDGGSSRFLQEIGFKEIYLVCSNENVKIYP